MGLHAAGLGRRCHSAVSASAPRERCLLRRSRRIDALERINAGKPSKVLSGQVSGATLTQCRVKNAECRRTVPPYPAGLSGKRTVNSEPSLTLLETLA